MHDVAVIGYGPTGATLANLLAICGLDVLVLDREAAAYHLPRAVHFDDETMRVFQTVGIADALAEKVHINPGMRFVDQQDTLLLDWPRPQEITPMGWHASYRLHQPDLEALLRTRLETRDGVTIRTRCHVDAVTPENDHVLIAATDRETGVSERFAARYVVGCDGANSLVRETLGASMENLGLEQRWLVVDLLLRRPRPDLGDHSIQFCRADRPMTYCRSPANRRRWEITVLEDETDAEISAEARVWELLSRWITPDDADLERRAVYTFRSALARCWRKDRLMIAGDAAHLTPPFMGQGMCAGIRDVSNLAWKLAMALQGDNAVLDTYQPERAPNARAYIETAVRLGELITSMDSEVAGKLAQDQAEGKARMRSLSPGLGPSARLKPDPHGWVGQLFPQPVLTSGHRLDDVVGYAPFIVIDLPGHSLNTGDEPSLAAILDGMGVRAVRVGADRHIEAVLDDSDEIERWMRPRSKKLESEAAR